MKKNPENLGLANGKRINFVLEPENIYGLKELARQETAPHKPVTASMLANRAVAEFLERHRVRGINPRPKTLRAAS